ncbi:MAG: LysR family transcriptional regulator [Pseudomonadota bacterium]
MLHRLNFKHLRYFWAVAHEGNLTRAAQNLGVSQSALSVQIQKLEEVLEYQLFERQGKQLVLTEAGQIVLQYGDTIFAAGDEMLAVLRAEEPSSRRLLRIGALATLSRNFQTAFLEPLNGRNDVRLHLRSGGIDELLRLLETHQIDVLLANYIPTRTENSLWVPHLIDQQPVSLICHPEINHPDGLDEQLQSLPLLLPTTESSIRAALDAYFERQQIRPHILGEIDDMAMIRLLARNKFGAAVVPPIVARDELASGRLIEISQIEGLFEAFYALTPARQFPNAILAQLLDRETSSSLTG